jgi:septal ring factor EnvC (AmiA/AmiB activator)
MATAAEKEQLAALQGQVTSLQTQLTDKKEALEAAYASRDLYAQENSKLTADLTREKAEHDTTRRERDEAQGQVNASATIIDELNQELSAAQEGSHSAGHGEQEVEHEGQAYRVVIPAFQFRGEDYTAADVTEGSDLLADLVRIQSGVLELVD